VPILPPDPAEVELMEILRQVSVVLENKPGRLADLLSALARAKVNVLALTIMSHHEQGVLRFLPDDLAKTTRILKDLGAPHTETEVLVVEVRNQPGALAQVCEVLGAGHVNIEYAYSSTGRRGGKTTAVLKVANTEKAVRLLGEGARGAPRRRPEPRFVRDQRTYQPRR
jgi:hypothetical protein